MIFGVLNRLIGRKDGSEIRNDAVNAYVEGNASGDQVKIVEEMKRENPALEKDLSTQSALLSVLGRIEKIEAPRSFAVTPEMVAAAERSESGLSRFAELFTPQRKLALAPAIIAGIAALGVALLTIGDISGVIEQSEARRDAAFSTEIAAESADAGAALPSTGNPGNPGPAGAPGSLERSTASSQDATVVVTERGDTVLTEVEDSAALAPASTSAPAAAAGSIQAEAEADTAEAPVAEAGEAMPEPEMAAGTAEEPPSLAAEAPLAESDDQAGATTELPAQDDALIEEEEIALAKSSDRSTADGDESHDADIANDGAAEITEQDIMAYSPTDAAQVPETKDGISLPLWQLQVALAALALAAVGAWAGLRRARGE